MLKVPRVDAFLFLLVGCSIVVPHDCAFFVNCFVCCVNLTFSIKVLFIFFHCNSICDRERIAKAKSIFDKRALELLNRAKLKKSKLKQKGTALPLQGHTSKPDSSQVRMTMS